MQPFNRGLEVGHLAMIIGCRLPENSHSIGSIVTVEFIAHTDDGVIPIEYLIDYPDHTTIRESTVLVRGVSSNNSRRFLVEGISCYHIKNLMPLPPLEDEQFSKETEKDMEAV